MVFPPAVLAADKTDLTNTPGDHADHHNDLAEAINGMVPVLQGAQAAMPKPGAYLCSPTADGANTDNFTVNRASWTPLWLPRAATITDIGVLVTGLVAGMTFRFGLYDDQAFMPHALVGPEKTATSAATGFRSGAYALPRPVVGPGLIWLCSVLQGAGAIPATRLISRPAYSLGRAAAPVIGDWTVPPVAWQQTGVNGALPAVAAPNAMSDDTHMAPLVWAKML